MYHSGHSSLSEITATCLFSVERPLIYCTISSSSQVAQVFYVLGMECHALHCSRDRSSELPILVNAEWFVVCTVISNTLQDIQRSKKQCVGGEFDSGGYVPSHLFVTQGSSINDERGRDMDLPQQRSWKFLR